MSFAYDRVFILPPGQQIPDSVIDDALDAVNPDAQIPILTRPTLSDVYKDKSSYFYTTGLQPQIIREETAARFGVAWFTDHGGRKHVRIIADVVRLKRYFSNSLWPNNYRTENLVYPTLTVASVSDVAYLITCKCGSKGTLEDLKWDGVKCLQCQEAERYERETGFQVYTPKRTTKPN